jgi:uroporphyrinogen-III synthase
MRLIVLRPQPGASETVKNARDLNIDAIAVPLFEIQPVDWSAPEQSRFDGLLLTSANAVRCAGEGLLTLRGLPAYCVGEATAAEARGAGLDIAATGSSGVERLLKSIDPDLKLLHLAGEHRTITDAQQVIQPITVYRSAEREAAADDVNQSEGNAVAVHSPRAAKRFALIVQEFGIDRKTIAILAISQAAADAAGDGWKSVHIASAPDDSSLLALATTLCNNPS